MNPGAAFVLALLALAFFALPVAAVVVALVAMGKAGRAERALKEREKESEALRTRLLKMEQRLGRMESGGGPVVEASSQVPRAAEPPVPPPAAVPAGPPPAPAVLTAAAAAPAVSVKLPRAPSSPSVVRPQEGTEAAFSPAPPTPRPRPSLPEKGPGLEERLGARLPVWIGSVALTLAGAYLVKYSFDRGLLSPGMRVLLGVLFGALLLGAGEGLRKRSAYVAAGLSASGIADLYACFLAASNLYHLIPPAAGFVLMAGATALAVLLSLRQGALIAVLGLVGGFFTPVLIQTGEARPGPLFAYLFLLEVGLLAVTRQRRWWPLAGLTLLSAWAWAAAWLGLAFKPWQAPHVGGFILASTLAFAVAGLWGRSEEGPSRGAPAWLTWASAGSGLLMMAALAGADHYSALEWLLLALLGAGCLVLGRLESEFEGLAWLAALVCAGLMVVWGAGLPTGDLPRFLWTSAGFGALFGAGSYACLWGSERPHRWASLSAVSALAYLLIAYQGEGLTRGEAHFGIPALLLAVIFAAAALPVASRRRALPSGDLALSALAVAVTAFVALAVPFELKREWMSVGWSVELVLLLWVSGTLDLPPLRTVAWPLGALAALRLLLNPGVLAYPTGDLPVFNWILYGYGVPALAFVLGAWLAGRLGEEMLSGALQWGAFALGLGWIVLQVRQGFHPGRLDHGSLGLFEAGTLTAALMVYGLALLAAWGRWSLPSLEWGGKIAVGLGLLWCGLVEVLAFNPLWNRVDVGSFPVFNHLLWLYGGPVLLAFLAAWILDGRGETALPRLLGVIGMGLALVLLTLEVRQGFQGGMLNGHTLASSEKYAYSIAWVLFGTCLLTLGIVTRGPVVRFASLAVMLLAVGKVFLYDTAQLRDLYRVFSFLGLGLSLLLLAFLYQRFVFGTSRTPTGPAEGL